MPSTGRGKTARLRWMGRFEGHRLAARPVRRRPLFAFGQACSEPGGPYVQRRAAFVLLAGLAPWQAAGTRRTTCHTILECTPDDEICDVEKSGVRGARGRGRFDGFVGRRHYAGAGR